MNRPKILVVDDMDTNRIILQEILSDKYDVEQASDGIDAISVLLNAEEKPSLILLDVMMPGMDGYETLEFIKKEPHLCRIPVIFITALDEEQKGLSIGAVDFINKPFDANIVRLRVANHIELSVYREELEILVEKKANELLVTRENFLETMANLIEYRSMESGEHVKRTKDLAKILLTHMLKTKRYHLLLEDEGPDMIIKAVPLHDIGKIGIPDNILLKPGRFTPEEFEVMKTHTTIGASVIESLMSAGEDRYLKHCYDITRHHHERWDGKGYPDRMAGYDIPISARIVALIDVYDALTSERCYKKPVPHEEAMQIIKDSSGLQFDPNIVSAFLEINQQFKDYECMVK